MQVDTERAETEVKDYVESQNAGSAALTTLKTAKNIIDELVAKDKFEELDILKQNADDDALNTSTFIFILNKPDETKKISG